MQSSIAKRQQLLQGPKSQDPFYLFISFIKQQAPPDKIYSSLRYVHTMLPQITPLCYSVNLSSLWHFEYRPQSPFGAVKTSKNTSISLLQGYHYCDRRTPQTITIHHRLPRYIICITLSEVQGSLFCNILYLSISPSKCGKNLLPQFRNFDCLLCSK